jgi:hypothetical protein
MHVANPATQRASEGPEFSTARATDARASAVQRVEGSKEFVSKRLWELLRAHGVPARGHGRVTFPNRPGLWMEGELFSYRPDIAQLDVRLGGFDGQRVLIESIAGFGETLEEQGRSALDLFANASFHVLLSAFLGCEPCHGTQREVWTTSGGQRVVERGLITAVFAHPPRLANGTPDYGFHQVFLDHVKNSELSPGTHWIRLYQMRRRGEALVNEVLLDNEISDELQSAMAEYPWPVAAEVYDVRTFWVLKDIEE